MNFSVVNQFVSSLSEVCNCVVGGESVVENCQILQTRVNRLKSAKDHVDATKLKGYSCDINFTGMFA